MSLAAMPKRPCRRTTHADSASKETGRRSPSAAGALWGKARFNSSRSLGGRLARSLLRMLCGRGRVAFGLLLATGRAGLVAAGMALVRVRGQVQVFGTLQMVLLGRLGAVFTDVFGGIFGGGIAALGQGHGITLCWLG